MQMNIFDTLNERGFIKQATNENEVREILGGEEKILYYTGFDPTAPSLHVGSLVPIMAMAHLQKAGHTPIAIIGGGTAMIGDPSGKTETRRMMPQEEIHENGLKILGQLKRYLSLSEGKGFLINNADWLLNLRYVDFLRDIGRFFRVNEMIRTEAYRQRMEREEGLSFTEFNYQLLQSYDFLVLFSRYRCVLQMGGDDQWGNIVAGVDLVRRVKHAKVHGLTFPLLETATRKKMGKTESGTIWLDTDLTSPYDFYQYWINVDDRDVERFLALFTFLPMDQIKELSKLEGQEIRKAKVVLAYEVTKLAHGEINAINAAEASVSAFREKGSHSDIPFTTLAKEKIKKMLLVEVLLVTNLATSRTHARRLISQGAVQVNGKKMNSCEATANEHIRDDSILLRIGKKKYHKIVLT